MITEKKKKYASFTEFCALNTEKKPTSKLYFSETNDPIFEKTSLCSNFVLLYNISRQFMSFAPKQNFENLKTQHYSADLQ